MALPHGSTCKSVCNPRTNSTHDPFGFRPLDPLENNSRDWLSRPPEDTQVRPFEAPKLPGHYRRQYRAAARSSGWGRTGASCGQAVLVAESAGAIRVMPVLCDTWACLLCGTKRAAWLMVQIRLAQVRYQLDEFWTLTIRTSTCTAAESSALVKRSWNRLRTALNDRYGKFSYIWTLEHTKAGYAHLHLVTSLSVRSSELSALWLKASGGSWIVDVEPVRSDRASSYLAKYCTQQARQRVEPDYVHLKGTRFFSKSRDVEFDPFRPVGERVELLDQETGEVTAQSAYRRIDVPYWEAVELLKGQGRVAVVERVQGVPFAVFGAGSEGG